MATIEKRTGPAGSLVFRVKVRRKGQTQLTATFSKLSEAKKWAQIQEGAVLEGRHFPGSHTKNHTRGEMIDRYVQDVLPHKKALTAYTQRYQYDWWKEHLGHTLLSEIRPPLLVEYRDKLSHLHGPATVNRYLAALSHAFTIAVKEWEWLDNNPLSRVSKLREPRGRTRYLSEDERQRLLKECRVSGNRYLYLVVVLSLSTAARKAELLRLRWTDVDLKRGRLIFHQTKNGEHRSVALTGYARELLCQRWSEHPRRDTLVFPTGIKKAWYGALKRARIENFRFHDLRYSAASYLAMNGASLMEIAEILGHKTLTMVKRYAHLSEAHTAGVVARMNQAIFG